MALAQTGDTVGHYRLLDKIGAGGMGVVYAAEHMLLGRRAAIKFLHAEVTQNKQVVDRFFTEARAIASIKNPAIVEVYDFGYHDGMAYLVMEHLEGRSLAKCLRDEGTLSAERTVAIALAVASALEAAHRAGIVHRDLKPANVFLATSDVRDLSKSTTNITPLSERVCLLDFGVAKLLRNDGSWSPNITTSDLIVGTPTFMSPEQCRGGGEVDERADLYALGCVMYAMLLGRPPFLGEGGGAVIAQHIYEPPVPPSAIDRRVPAELERILLCLLEKHPDKRFQSGADLARALRACDLAKTEISEAPFEAPPPERPVAALPPPRLQSPLMPPPSAEPARRSWWWLGGIGGIAAAIGVFAAVSSGSTDGAKGDKPAAAISNAAPFASAADHAAHSADAASVTSPTKRVELVIRSTPSGAAVFAKGESQRLGRTPYRLNQDAGEGFQSFELRLDGHEVEEIRLPLDRSVEADVVLREIAVTIDAGVAPLTRKAQRPSAKGKASKSRSAKTDAKTKVEHDRTEPKKTPIGDSMLDPFSR